MPTRELESWMWSEALRVLDRADRMQRVQVTTAVRKPPVQWEPAIDVYETSDAIWIQAALPGVDEHDLKVEQQGDLLVISGSRRLLGMAHTGSVHRLEIPRGRFERRLRLPTRTLQVATREFLNGCLILQLTKR